jgi:hypothetical protein
MINNKKINASKNSVDNIIIVNEVKEEVGRSNTRSLAAITTVA